MNELGLNDYLGRDPSLIEYERDDVLLILFKALPIRMDVCLLRKNT